MKRAYMGPTERDVRKIIDSKVPAIVGDMGQFPWRVNSGTRDYQVVLLQHHQYDVSPSNFRVFLVEDVEEKIVQHQPEGHHERRVPSLWTTGDQWLNVTHLSIIIIIIIIINNHCKIQSELPQQSDKSCCFLISKAIL